MSSEARAIDDTGVSSGFFDSLMINGEPDRLYSANQMASIFDGIINDGVYHSIGECLQVRAAGDGLKLNVMPGRAWFDHTWILNDNISVFELKDAEQVFDRIDAVVIETNFEEDIRDSRILIVTGEPSDPPAKPELKNNKYVKQHALAYISVYAEKGNIITDAEIEDVIGTEETPYVTGILEVLSRDDWYAQWRQELDNFVDDESDDLNKYRKEFRDWVDSKEAEGNKEYALLMEFVANIEGKAEDQFNQWFEHIRHQLDPVDVSKLQNELDAIAKTCFFRYYGMTNGDTLFKPDGAIVETKYVEGKTDEIASTMTTTKDVAKDGTKVITEVLDHVDSLFTFKKTTCIGKVKNLVPFPYKSKSTGEKIPIAYADGDRKEINGITFTVDDEGILIADGLATKIAEYIYYENEDISTLGGKGSSISLRGGYSDRIWVQLEIYNNNSTVDVYMHNGQPNSINIDISDKAVSFSLRALVGTDQSPELVKFYTEIRSYVVAGITWRVLEDRTIQASGTATEDSIFRANDYRDGLNHLDSGQYTLSGCPEDGSEDSYYVVAKSGYHNDDTQTDVYRDVMIDTGNGITKDIMIGEQDSVGIEIVIKAGTTVSGLKFKPQLERSAVKHDYVEYGKTGSKYVTERYESIRK